MIEIECVRCKLNIDEYERVSLVLIEGDLLPVHDTCELEGDIHTTINASELTTENLAQLIYQVIVMRERQVSLMKENADLRYEKEGMRQEIISMNNRLGVITSERDAVMKRYEEQRAAIRALWREDAPTI